MKTELDVSRRALRGVAVAVKQVAGRPVCLPRHGRQQRYHLAVWRVDFGSGESSLTTCSRASSHVQRLCVTSYVRTRLGMQHFFRFVDRVDGVMGGAYRPGQVSVLW